MIKSLVKHWSWPLIVSIGINILVLVVFTRLTIFAVEPQERRLVLNYLPEEMLAELTPPPPPPVEKKKKVIPPKDFDMPKLDDLAYDLLKVKPEEQLPPPKPNKVAPPPVKTPVPPEEKIEPNGLTPIPVQGTAGADKQGDSESNPSELANNEINRNNNSAAGIPRTVRELELEAKMSIAHGNIFNTSMYDATAPGGSASGGANFANALQPTGYITSAVGNPDILLPVYAGGGINGIAEYNRWNFSPLANGRGPIGIGRGPDTNGNGNGNNSGNSPNDGVTTAKTLNPGDSGGGTFHLGTVDGIAGGIDFTSIPGMARGYGRYNIPGNGGWGYDGEGNGSIGTGGREDLTGQAPKIAGTKNPSRLTPSSGLGNGNGHNGPVRIGGAPIIREWRGKYPSEAEAQNVQGNVTVEVTFNEKGKAIKSVAVEWKNEKGQVDILVFKLLGNPARADSMEVALLPKEIPTIDGQPVAQIRNFIYRFRR